MNWSTFMERYGMRTEACGADPLYYLGAEASKQPVRAKVNCSLGTSADFGQVKVGVSVTVECPQTDEFIGLAAHAAAKKAAELLNNCASAVGAPTIEGIE